MRRARALALYARVFQGPLDVLRYARQRYRYARGRTSAPACELRVRALGGSAVLCRPTRDVWTFKHTFIERFHRPPIDLPWDAVIVDLGSNVGYTVADFATHHPASRIVGVELDEDNFRIAERNVAIYGDRVTLIHAAVWSSDGQVQYGGDEVDSFAVLDGGPSDPRARVAPAKRLTTILDECALDRVDYMKMDIEGAEAVVLAPPLEWATRVRAIKVEVHPPATVDGVHAALTGAGFTCTSDRAHPLCVIGVRR